MEQSAWTREYDNVHASSAPDARLTAPVARETAQLVLAGSLMRRPPLACAPTMR